MSHSLFFFFFNDTATTEIYTLSLHDALPILNRAVPIIALQLNAFRFEEKVVLHFTKVDRKSTRLNSSHTVISYAVFCLKKKKKQRHGATKSGPPVDDRQWSTSSVIFHYHTRH